MKKTRGIIIIAAFALVLAGALAVIGWYRLKSVMRLQEEVYVITDANVARNLLRGTEPEDRSYELTKVEAGLPVYQRGNSLFVGEEKEKVESGFPFFANNGEAVMMVKDDQVLVDKSFEEITTFGGMYVSDGLSFNYDKSQADDASYLFLKLSNGLFMNVQPIRFDYPGGQDNVRMNSIFCFEKSAVRYYGMQAEHALWYGELPTVNMLTVTIGGETYSYEQLLGLLGLAGRDYRPKVENKEDASMEEPLKPDTQKPEPEKTEAEEQETEPEQDPEEKEPEPDAVKDVTLTAARDKKTVKDNTVKPKKEKTVKEKKNNSGSKGSRPGAGQSISSGSAPGGADISADGNDTVSGNTVSGNTVSGNSVSGNTLEPEFKRPEATLEDFTADIYSLSTSLKIDDPSYTLRRVVIQLYWQDEGADGPAPESDNPDDYKLRYRKTIRSEGDILLDNLPPDTWIYAKGFIYYTKDGETENYEFYDGFEKRVQTKSMDELDDIYLTFEPENGEVKKLPHQMQLFKLAASGPNPNVLNKVSRVEINVTATDQAHQGVTGSCQINISEFRNKFCYAGPEMEPEEEDGDGMGSGTGGGTGSDGMGSGTGDGTGSDGTGSGGTETIVIGADWVSSKEAMNLPSNMEFDYEITLRDSFGNAFTKVVNGYHGKARTTEDGEAVDWKTNKSLTCCRNTEEPYWNPVSGHGATSRTEPYVLMKQVKFADTKKDIDRAKYEIQVVDADGAVTGHETQFYMQIYEVDVNGVISTDPVTCYFHEDGSAQAPVQGTQFALTQANIINAGTGSYEITGLTAGSIYELRVYGQYTLNDGINEESQTPRQIGRQRFTTANLSAYGSVMYTLQNSHIKTTVWPDGSKKVDENGTQLLSPYESATAQELSMQINYGANMTNPILTDMLSEIRVGVTKETESGSEPVLEAVFDRQKMEQVKLADLTAIPQADGATRYEIGLQSIAVDGSVKTNLQSMPKLYLEERSTAAATVWEAFAAEQSNEKLVFFFGEGSLSPDTSYQLNVQTSAAQGGENHDVTAKGAAYKRLSFATLKRMPYVSMETILIVSDYIEIRELVFHDPDGSIMDGVVLKRLSGVNGENVNVLENERMTVGDGEPQNLRYDGLVRGNDYRIEFAPVTIRRDRRGSYTLRQENLFSHDFKAGAGLNGRLVFESIDYPLDNTMAGSTETLDRSDYRLYNAGGYTMGSSIAGDGTVTDDGSNSIYSWAASPLIPVEPGGLYYIDGARGISSSQWMSVAFYTDIDKEKPIRSTAAYIDRKTWQVSDAVNGSNLGRTFYISPSDNVIQIPAASAGGKTIKYMRFNMVGYDTFTNIPAYATADCFLLKDSTKEIPGAVTPVNTQSFIKDSTTNVYRLEELPVEPGEKYVVAAGAHRYKYTYYDGSGNVLQSGDTSQYMASAVFSVPTDPAVKSMTLETYNNANYTEGGNLKLYRLNTKTFEWLRSRDITKLINTLTVKVEDNRNNLVLEKNRNIYVEVYEKNGDQEKQIPLNNGDMKLEVTADELETINFSQLITFEGASNKSFRVRLYVKYNGEPIDLDSVEFETNRTLECIHDRTELAKLMRYPSGDFIVVEDIPSLRKNEGFYFGNGNAPFRGNLDFQGHSLTSNGGWTGISTLENGGVVENLVLNSKLEGKISGSSGLVNTNRGVIRNIVVSLDLGQGMYRKEYIGGISRYNSGTIENFALYYEGLSSMYVGKYFGGICQDNNGSGVIKNGYVYCPGILSASTATFGGTLEPSRGCESTTLAAGRSWGDIRNVYVVGDLSVERYTEDGTLPNSALLTVNYGTVRNCFTVGDLNRILWTEGVDKPTRFKQAYLVYGPVVAGNQSRTSTTVKNNYYYSYVSEPYANNFPGVQEQVKDTSLFLDESFYARTVNSEQAFLLSDIGSGYFPRVQMPLDELMMQQTKAPLVSAGIGVGVTFAYATIDEVVRQDNLADGVSEDYALATLVFRNRLGRSIDSVTIDGLKVEPQNPGDTKFEQGPDEDEDSIYYWVKVKLSVDRERKDEAGKSAPLYRKQYDITGFSWNDGKYTTDVYNRQIEVTFPKLVTQKNWVGSYDPVAKRWPTVFDDMQGCYRLGEDIDYEAFSTVPVDKVSGSWATTQRRAAMEVFARRADGVTTFSGSLDGGYLDGDGKLQNHKLLNFRLGSQEDGHGSGYVYLINVMRGGELKNLTVENLSINVQGMSWKHYSALVAESSGNSVFENMVMKNVSISNVWRFAASLVGNASYTAVQDCVLNGFRAESSEDAYGDFRIGGLTGSAGNGVTLDNCLARNVNIRALKGTTDSGMGGISGVGGIIKNCYAQGKIDSNFMYTGGIVGQGGIVSGIWSKVNLISSARYVGGVSGYNTTVSNALVLGEVFCTAPDLYNRVVGNSTKKLTSCYASELQKVNSVIDKADSGDAEGFMTVEEMGLEFWYWDKLNLGKAFDYTVLGNGCLPLLKYKDGHDILPEQELYQVVPESVPFTAEGVAKDNFAPDWKTNDASVKVHEYDLAVTLRFEYEADKDPGKDKTEEDARAAFVSFFEKEAGTKDYGKLSIEDMEFNAASVDCTYDSATHTYTLVLQKASPIRYLDSYRVVWDTGADQESAILTFKKEDGEETPLYRHIYRVENDETVAGNYAQSQTNSGVTEPKWADPNSWQGVTRVLAGEYENFLIMENLNFASINNSDPWHSLKTGLKINRLEGSRTGKTFEVDWDKDTYTETQRREFLMKDLPLLTDTNNNYITIHNLNFTETNTASVNWIYEMRGEMKYLRFSNIKWKGKGGSIGIVRYQRGNVAYVDIDKFTLNYIAAGNDIGFFTSKTDGSVDYVRGRDIVVERLDSTDTLGAGWRVGGIFGSSNAQIRHVGIKGTAPAADKDRKDKNSWTYRIEGRLPEAPDDKICYYTGGIGGQMNNACMLYAENIYVAGSREAGAISGWVGDCGYNETQFKETQSGNQPLYHYEAENCYVKGRIYVGGITGSGGPRWGISRNNVVYAENMYAGGVGGSGSGYYNKAIDCRIAAKNGYAGGLAGSSGYHYSYSEVRGCVIVAPHHVGGMASNYSGTGDYSGGTVHDSIIWGQEYVGGIWGYSNDAGCANAYVKNCYIGRQGAVPMPVVTEEWVNGNVTDTLMPALQKNAGGAGNVDDTYTITEKDAGNSGSASAEYVGGLVGFSCGGRVYSSMVDSDVYIYAGKFGGGIFGAGGGGEQQNGTRITQNVESGAQIYIKEGFGGGYAGMLIGYAESPKGPDILYYPVTKMTGIIIAGSVKGSMGAEHIGGFVGCYSPGTFDEDRPNYDGRPLEPEFGTVRSDLDTGYRSFISASNFARITLALTEVTGKDPKLIGEVRTYEGGSGYAEVDFGKEHELSPADGDNPAVTEKEGISYLRVYGGMKLNTTPVRDGAASGWRQWQKPADNTTQIAGPEEKMLVNAADLRSIEFYYAALKCGGLELRRLGEGNQRYYNTNGTRNNFRYFVYKNKNTNPDGSDDSDNPTADVFPLIDYNGNQVPLYVYEWQGKDSAGKDITQKRYMEGIPIPDDNVTITLADISYALDHVSTYASGAGSVNVEFPEILVTEAEEEELAAMLADEDAEQTAGTKALRKAAGVRSAAEAEDGMQAEADMAAETDVVRMSAGKSMRRAAAPMSARDVETADGQTSDGAIEVMPVSYFQIYDGNGELVYQDQISRQVYTIPYDFASTLTVKVYAGDESRSYALTGDALRHTVMTWNDHCYYLKSDGIYRDKGVYVEDENADEKNYANTEKIRDGEFLHLYQGEVLDEMGNITDVESESIVEQLEEEELFVPTQEEVPAYVTTYGGEEILTYRTFSTTQDNEVVSDYRLFAHNDKLFGMDPYLDQPYGQKFWNFVADYYSTSKGSAEYLSVLGENFVLEDYKTALNWPVDEENGRQILDNYQIREVGDNLNADKSYVIIRYYDNTAAAFDYLTGSLLFLDDSEKKSPGFMEYANMWLLGKKAALNGTNAYMGAQGLVQNLAKNPIDDALVVGYVKDSILEGGTGEPGTEQADLAIDGSSRKDGGSMLTGSNMTGSSLKRDEKPDGTGAKPGKDDGTDLSAGQKKDAAPAAPGGKDSDGKTGDPASGTMGKTEEEGKAELEAGTGSGMAEEDAKGNGRSEGAEDGEGTGSGEGVGTEKGREGSEGTGEGSGEGIGTSKETGKDSIKDTDRESRGEADGDEAGIEGSAGENGEKVNAGGNKADGGSHEAESENGKTDADADKAVGRDTQTGAGEGRGAGKDAEAGTGAEAGEGRVTGKEAEAGTGAEAGEGRGAGKDAEAGTGAEAGEGRGAGEDAEAGTGAEAGEGRGAGKDAEAGTGAEAGEGRGAGEDAEAEAETGAEAEAGEGEGETENNAADNGITFPALTSDRAYVTMLTAETDGYEVYRASELLSQRGSALMSENQKLKLLEANGLLQSPINLESMKLTREENRKGLILVGTATLSMFVLIVILYRKKRKLNKT